MANAHVFPGGVIDEDDKCASWTQRCAVPEPAFPLQPEKSDSMPLRVCAARELFEETGLLLARPQSAAASTSIYSTAHSFASLPAQQAAQAASSASATSFRHTLSSECVLLDSLRLAPWMRWITPEFEAERRRFDTFFYLAALQKPFDKLTADPKEVAGSVWLSPVEALDLAQKQSIVLPPPTTYILRELEQLETIEQVFAQSVKRMHDGKRR
jgi:8-oxo-dGTP pyrophosphatase MutT (NUDIX family)